MLCRIQKKFNRKFNFQCISIIKSYERLFYSKISSLFTKDRHCSDILKSKSEFIFFIRNKHLFHLNMNSKFLGFLANFSNIFSNSFFFFFKSANICFSFEMPRETTLLEPFCILRIIKFCPKLRSFFDLQSINRTQFGKHCYMSFSPPNLFQIQNFCLQNNPYFF